MANVQKMTTKKKVRSMHYLPLTEAPLLKRNHYYGKAIVMQFQSHEGYAFVFNYMKIMGAQINECNLSKF